MTSTSHPLSSSEAFHPISSESNQEKVLVVGITGQDAFFLIRHLLFDIKNVTVYSTLRRHGKTDHSSYKHFFSHSNFGGLRYMDLTDSFSVNAVFKEIKPDYCFNLAAQSHVHVSHTKPDLTERINCGGIINILEAAREYNKNCRIYSAGTSEQFGGVSYSPQDLKHPYNPLSPYGSSKVAAEAYCNSYRNSYKLYVVHSILFNHESEHRGVEFVTRKITTNVARIKQELDKSETPIPFELGNIYSKRDWSHASDFVRAMWLMLQQSTPERYLLSSNETHTIKEFIDLSCEYAEIPDLRWEIDEDNPLNTKLYSGDHVILKISKDFYRPADVELLHGDSTESREKLDWKPEIGFKELVRLMVAHDLKTKH